VNKWKESHVNPEWSDLIGKTMKILQKEAELQEIVQLVGPDALPERERVILEISRMIREDFLQQNAFHEIDTYTSLKKQYLILKAIWDLHDKVIELGMSAKDVAELEVTYLIGKIRYTPEDEVEQLFEDIERKIGEMRR